ncbi:MAG: CehA/McbA family metallohydrolase [Anaerolineales bacterium]|nr:CehA/McbA family metallohydrolase [Anaerolineales bacterium]
MDGKFTPVFLEPFFNIDRAGEGWHAAVGSRLSSLPHGKQNFRGIPFELGSHEENCWLALKEKDSRIDIPLSGTASYLIFVHFCDLVKDDQQNPWLTSDNEVGFHAHAGEILANYTLCYEDGEDFTTPIRRRFEIEQALRVWGQEAFAALPHEGFRPVSFKGTIPQGKWGFYQQGLTSDQSPTSLRYWIYALKNPNPRMPLKALRISSTGISGVVIAGITMYHGKDHPLRYSALKSLKINLKQPICLDELHIEIDTGIITRRYQTIPIEPQQWLQAPTAGLGEETLSILQNSFQWLDITANCDAILSIENHKFDLGEAFANFKGESKDELASIEILSPNTVCIQGKVIEETTSQVTPVRISFRTIDGRYFPPYGHRHTINANWFEDYGGDLLLGSTPYAYIDGTFRIELPVGEEVLVEITKGFEYNPIRKRLTVEPGQSELTFLMQRAAHWREHGWVTADTHVHFISPQTAWLEARAEGVNLVNLLASQWGELFTNIHDISGKVSGASEDDTIIWVGTENRQHVLGHISLLGVKGNPVFPMGTGGPDEGYFGDPTVICLAEWADLCHEREGLVILPHFPQPYCEAAADIALGKIDAVEIRNFIPGIESSSMKEWYRYLNCGYQVPVVGGTDKMSAGIPIGGVRTYARLLGDQDLSFDSWAQAVRAGRTFTTSGPLIEFAVEGKHPGDCIKLSEKGGKLFYEANIESIYPVDEVQIILNGNIIDSVVSQKGERKLNIGGEVITQESCWLAARCVSKLKAQHTWPVNHVAAHTSPVYIQCGNSEVFNLSDATHILTLLEGGLTWLDTLSIPISSERHNVLKNTFNTAHEVVTKRLYSHHYHHQKSKGIQP